MPVINGEEGKRKRRTHEKSRRGCRNCKLRRVKCDETRPKCLKCTNYGVTCNFDSKIPDLQMSHDGTALKTNFEDPQPQQQVAQISLCKSIDKIEVPPFLYPAIDVDFRLDREFLDRFSRFRTRTVLEVGSPTASAIFSDIATELSFAHPYLMHSAQTITAIHDRYLSALPFELSSRRTTAELYHLSQAAILLNQKLSAPIEPQERDAVWATAALLGIIAFSTIDATCPEDAWPLKASGPSDFDWISMSEKKVAVWQATDPSRADSLFKRLAMEAINLQWQPSLTYTSGIEGIPSEFVDLYDLSPLSTPENSPYFAAVRTLTSLMTIECERANIVAFLGFISHLQAEFKSLVYERDPRALLLLAYWHAKVGRAVWWLERRTLLEGQATCLYLERYYSEETAIQNLLQYPKMKLGLLGNTLQSMLATKPIFSSPNKEPIPTQPQSIIDTPAS